MSQAHPVVASGEAAPVDVEQSTTPRASATLLRSIERAAFEGRYLLLLLAIDGTFAFAVYASLSLGLSPLGFGDYPGIYTFSGVNLQWLGSVSIFPLTVQVLALAVGPAWAQNLFFAAVFFLPSVGAFAFLSTVTRLRLFVVAVSFAFGTLANPTLVNGFLGGGFEHPLLLFFGFLCFRYLWLARLERHSIRSLLIAGVCFALALTSVGGFSGTEYAGIGMVGLFAAPILVLDISKARLPIVQRLTRLFAFAGSTIVMGLPVIAGYVSSQVAASVSPETLQGLRTFVLGNVAFTYRSYGLASALFSLPQSLPNISWTPVSVLPWVCLVLLSLLLGITAAIELRDDRRWLAFIFGGGYLALAVLIALIQSGTLTSAYGASTPLDFFDDPYLFLVMQSFALPVLLVLGFDWVLRGRNGITYRADAHTGSDMFRQGRLSARARRLWRRARGRPWDEATAGAAIVILGVATFYLFCGNLGQQLSESPALEEGSAYAPTGLVAVHAWFTSLPSNQSGSILLLPSSYQLYSQAWSFVPQSRLWAIPAAANYTNASYDTSSYLRILDLLVEGQGAAFGYNLGIAGVQFVVILNQSEPLIVIPSYLQSGAPVMTMSAIVETLAISGVFDCGPLTAAFESCRNMDYVPSPAVFSGSAILEGPSNVATVGDQNFLLNSNLSATGNVTQWDRYPQSSIVPLGNDTVGLVVNSTSARPFAVFAGVINWTGVASYADRATDELYRGGVGYNSSLFNLSLVATAALSIPAGLNLQAFVYWYNVSPPGQLFTQFAVTSLGNFGPSQTRLDSDVYAPAGAVSARLYFYASADSGWVGNESVRVSTPSFDAGFQTLDILTNSSLALDVLSSMQADGVLPENGLSLIAPLAQSAGTSALRASEVVSAYPAAAVTFPLFGRQLTGNLSPLYDQRLSPPEAGRLVIDGSAAGAAGIQVSCGPGCDTNASFPHGGPFTIETTVDLSLESVFTLALTGNVTLATIGLVVPPASARSTVGSTVSIQLPVGALRVTSLNDSVHVQRIAWIQSGASAQVLNALADTAPLAFLLVFAAAVVVRAASRRRRGTGSPNGRTSGPGSL